MTIRAHGGVFNDQVLTGDLRHFRIVGADFSGAISDGSVILADISYGIDNNGDPIPHLVPNGVAVPGSAAEIVYVLLSTNGTVVIMNPDSTGLHFALDVNSSWVDANDIQTVIRALGANVGVDGVDLSLVTVIELEYLLGFDTSSENFLDLDDTPDTYVGNAGKVARVNGTEDGLVFGFPQEVDYIRVTAGGTLSAYNCYIVDTTSTQTLQSYGSLNVGAWIRVMRVPTRTFTLQAQGGETIMIGNGSIINSIGFNKSVETIFVYDGTRWSLAE